VKIFSEQTFKRISDILEKLFGTIMLVGAVSWAFYTFFYAPSHTTSPPPPRRATQNQPSSGVVDPVQAVLFAISIEVPYAEPHLEFLQGANLNVYLKRQDFERIPFPDRAGAVTRIGKAWCANVEHTFLPAIKIRDVRTGEQLARYSCVTGRVSISDGN
jgi:hypothetical protein